MRSERNKYRRFKRQRHNGWGKNLYRNPKEGYIAGVCAGLGDHFEVDHWVVRLLFAGSLLFTFPFPVLVYIAACFLLAPRPAEVVEDQVEYDEEHRRYRPRNIFRYGDHVSIRLARANERLRDVAHRVEAMESYVTSRRFGLDKEFSRIRE